MNDNIQRLEEELTALNAAPDADQYRQLDLLNELVRAYRHFDPQRALTLAQMAHDLATTVDYAQGRLACLVNLTVHHTHISPDFEIALGWANRALDLLASNPDASAHAYVLQCMGSVYRHLGDYATAHDYLMQALTLAGAANDLAMQGLVYNDLGVLYRYTQDYEQSFHAYQQGRALAETTGNQHRVALALNNLGDLLHIWGRTDEAIAHLEEAIALTQRLAIKILKPSVLDSLSEIHLEQGNYAAALACLQRAKAISEEFDNQFEMAALLRNIARVYQHQGAWNQALAYLHQALTVAESIKLKQEIFTCHELLAEIYETLDQPLPALRHYKQFHAIKEEVFNEEAAQKSKTLQVIHETAAAKREAEIYRLRNVELQAALEQVKQLSGLLPICGSCKKIRDDSGYWHEVELYIRAHSEADFSHGICPDCMATLYPHYYKKTTAGRTAVGPSGEN
jgi:tetratricopeptide (TPR) repeat protein